MIVDTDYEPPPKGSARAAILMLLGICGFFVFLAIAIPQVQARGGDLNSFFFVVLGGIAFAIAFPLILSLILGKLHLKGKKPGEVMRQLVGYTPMYEGELGVVIPSTPSTTYRELVPTTPAHTYVDDWEDDWGTGAELDDLNLLTSEEESIPTLLEPGGLRLTETFQPDPRTMVCQNMVFVGVRRFGKSNAMAILVRALARYGSPRFAFPIVIFDTEGEYEEMARRQHMPCGWLVGNEETDVPEGVRFKRIDAATAYTFGQDVLKNCWQVVVDLKSWNDDQAAEIMSEMMLGMEEWQQQQPTSRRIPFYIVIDEVVKWVPQNQGESTLSADARKMIQHALFDVAVRRGGKRGFGLIVAGTKIADMDKRILQGPWKLIFCQTEKNDLDRCKATPLNLDPDEVNALQPGESFVFCPQLPRGMYVKWPLSPVELGGKSPTIENLVAHNQRMQHGADDINEPTAGRRKTYSAPQQAATQHRPAIATPAPAQDTEEDVVEIDLQNAARLWNAGHNSVRSLARALSITPYRAGEVVIPAMVEAGLIEKKQHAKVLVRHPV